MQVEKVNVSSTSRKAGDPWLDDLGSDHAKVEELFAKIEAPLSDILNDRKRLNDQNEDRLTSQNEFAARFQQGPVSEEGKRSLEKLRSKVDGKIEKDDLGEFMWGRKESHKLTTYSWRKKVAIEKQRELSFAEGQAHSEGTLIYPKAHCLLPAELREQEAATRKACMQATKAWDDLHCTSQGELINEEMKNRGPDGKCFTWKEADESLRLARP
eukprot:g20180.t1